MKRRAAFALALALSASPLHAHAPYEHILARVSDQDGLSLLVVAHYTDGIIGADPVTVSIRDASGKTSIAETEPARDAIARCPSLSACTVFLYEPPFGVLPKQVLRVTRRGFVPFGSGSQWVLGVFLPISEHFGELLCESLALAIVPVVAQMLARRRTTLLITALRSMFAVAAFLWLSFCALGILLNTVVSLVWLALGVGGLALAPTMVRALLYRGLAIFPVDGPGTG